jgi:hypothetical protein
MRRTIILIALAVTLLCATVASGAGVTAPPRGVLTKVEYQELHASFEAMKHAGKTHGTLTHIARYTCRALTNATPLTAAEHGECEASLIYSFEFYAFPYAIENCSKATTAGARSRCALHAINTFERSVRAFIRTNAASTRAADPRHFTHKCLEYLLFTRPQAQTTHALWTALERYSRAVRHGNATTVTDAGNRLDADLVASRQAMSFNISVSVCRHQ